MEHSGAMSWSLNEEVLEALKKPSSTLAQGAHNHQGTHCTQGLMNDAAVGSAVHGTQERPLKPRPLRAAPTLPWPRKSKGAE
jgi:hypothetical protein